MKLEEQEGRWVGIGGMGGSGARDGMGDYDQNYMHVWSAIIKTIIMCDSCANKMKRKFFVHY